MKYLKPAFVLSLIAAGATWSCMSFAATESRPVKNIVLVHGAWVNGSGWKPVLEMQEGPTILVGHSYGGAIITDVGNDPKVVGLVYIAAHALDEGETEVANGKKFPNATKAVKRTTDDFLYLDPAFYPADFAADLPEEQAKFEAQAEELTAASVFGTPAGIPAWKTKPSWYMVAKADRIINPDLERMYAKRAHSHTVEIAGASHSVYESHPKDVAALIEQAAQHAQD